MERYTLERLKAVCSAILALAITWALLAILVAAAVRAVVWIWPYG